MGVPGEFYVQIRSLKFTLDDTAIMKVVVSVALPQRGSRCRTEDGTPDVAPYFSQLTMGAGRCADTRCDQRIEPALLAAAAAARLHAKAMF